MTLTGIDVSNWQRGVNVASLPGDVLVCKASEGESYRDGCFAGFMADGNAAGKLLGMYHYMSAQSVSLQVANFRQASVAWEKIAVPILDVESANITSSMVWDFANTYHAQTGVWPIVYASASRLSQYFNADTLKNCGVWVAAYGMNNPTSSWPAWTDAGKRFTAPSGATIAGWQFTSRFKALNLNVDASLWNMGEAAWHKYAYGDAPAATSAADASEVELWLLARKTTNGEYGNGDTRKYRLGSWYQAVQNRVNKLVSASDSTLAGEVIAGHLGNGETRKTILGSRYEAVQAIVNQRLG